MQVRYIEHYWETSLAPPPPVCHLCKTFKYSREPNLLSSSSAKCLISVVKVDVNEPLTPVFILHPNSPIPISWCHLPISTICNYLVTVKLRLLSYEQNEIDHNSQKRLRSQIFHRSKTEITKKKGKIANGTTAGVLYLECHFKSIFQNKLNGKPEN